MMVWIKFNYPIDLAQICIDSKVGLEQSKEIEIFTTKQITLAIIWHDCQIRNDLSYYICL